MSENAISKIFERLIEWKKYPGFSVERRFDIYLSFFLEELLGKEMGALIPEFPFFPRGEDVDNPDNKTSHIDFLFITKNGQPFVVELKTDVKSLKSKHGKKQIANYQKINLKKTIDKIKKLARGEEKTAYKEKYNCVLKELNKVSVNEDLKIVYISPERLTEYAGNSKIKFIVYREVVTLLENSKTSAQWKEALKNDVIVFIKASNYFLDK